MAYTRKITSTVKTHKVTIAGTGTVLGLVAILLTLSSYGVSVSTSGNLLCEGTQQDPCISFINITTQNYSIKFPVSISMSDSNVDYTMYKRSARGSWLKYNISGKTMANDTLWQLKLVGYKQTHQNVTVDIGTGTVGGSIIWYSSYPYEKCSTPDIVNDSVCNLYPLNLDLVPERMIDNCVLVVDCGA